MKDSWQHRHSTDSAKRQLLGTVHLSYSRRYIWWKGPGLTLVCNISSVSHLEFHCGTGRSQMRQTRSFIHLVPLAVPSLFPFILSTTFWTHNRATTTHGSNWLTSHVQVCLNCTATLSQLSQVDKSAHNSIECAHGWFRLESDHLVSDYHATNVVKISNLNPFPSIWWHWKMVLVSQYP